MNHNCQQHTCPMHGEHEAYRMMRIKESDGAFCWRICLTMSEVLGAHGDYPNVDGVLGKDLDVLGAKYDLKRIVGNAGMKRVFATSEEGDYGARIFPPAIDLIPAFDNWQKAGDEFFLVSQEDLEVYKGLCDVLKISSCWRGNTSNHPERYRMYEFGFGTENLFNEVLKLLDLAGYINNPIFF